MPNSNERTPQSRFSDRVSDYVRYRPGYPEALIEHILQRTGIGPGSVVADIGSGTGISARYFLEKGLSVYGVEPNGPMREAAEQYLSGFSAFRSVAGTAEATGLPEANVGLVVCAQAFHWFNNPETKLEFRRILKPGGWLALVWNDRKGDEPFQQAYEAVIQQYSIDYGSVTHRNITPEQIRAFFDPFPVEERTFYYAQQFDWPGFLGRVTSSSYMPAEGHPDYPQMKQALADIYQTFNQDGIVTFAYDTKLYLGQLK